MWNEKARWFNWEHNITGDIILALEPVPPQPREFDRFNILSHCTRLIRVRFPHRIAKDINWPITTLSPAHWLCHTSLDHTYALQYHIYTNPFPPVLFNPIIPFGRYLLRRGLLGMGWRTIILCVWGPSHSYWWCFNVYKGNCWSQ